MIEQLGIAVLGATAVLLTQMDEGLQRWAPIAGMAGQPFWFYAVYTNQQWGMFAVCILYTIAWGTGIKKHWL